MKGKHQRSDSAAALLQISTLKEFQKIAFTALVLESQVNAAWEADSMGFRG